MKPDPEGSTALAIGETLTDDLRGARPTADRVELDDVRARAEKALFGAAEPARLGRFVLLGPIASGGMGTVYSAYDPQLDRRVALKLLHHDRPAVGRARERLLGEARALAQVSHPNVVPIHDVTVIDDQVVIVMELVAGQTLAAWERARARSWRAIVEVYLEAGRGLAAAHRLDLVHRDFKPANAIIGDDGRVRVLDFGLARARSSDPDHADTAPQPPRPQALTATGEIVGTLGYMAPEQLTGGAVTAQSDQFSFCVALHRALHGVAPFHGDSVETLLSGIRAGRPTRATDGRRIPGWLVAIVDRGLAAEPASRHPSMTALLDQLGRERGWRRWRLPGVAALGVAAAVTTLVAPWRDPASDPLAACDGGVDEIAAVWNPTSRDDLAHHLDGIDAPSAKPAGARAMAELDAYRAAWTRAHTTGCERHRRGGLSDALFDRSAVCLQRRLDALAAAVRVLGATDRTSIAGAVDVVVGLPPVDACMDIDALQADAEPPATADHRREDTALRAQLSEAEALDRAGRAAEALAAVEALVPRADALSHAATVIDVELVRGRFLLFRGRLVEAKTALARAEELALDQGLLARAVVAAARRYYAESRDKDPDDEADRLALEAVLHQAEVIEPLSRSLRGDHFARPLLLNNLGTVHMVRGRRDEARRSFEAARRALDGVADPDLELTAIDQNLAMLTEDPGARAALVEGVWRRRRDQLGPHHLMTLKAQAVHAYYLADPASSRPLIEAALTSYRDFYPELLAARAEHAHYLGFLESELGDRAAAAAHYAESAALTSEGTTRELRWWHALSAGHASLLRDAPAAATTHFAAALALITGDDVWDRARAADARLGLGLAAIADRRAAAARPQLEQAIAAYAAVSEVTEDMEYDQRLAVARLALAGVLRGRGEADSARALERQAAAFYRAAGPTTYATRLTKMAP